MFIFFQKGLLLFAVYLLASRALSIEKTFIRNKCLPVCTNCVHFIEHINNYPSLPQKGKCKKYGEIDQDESQNSFENS